MKRLVCKHIQLDFETFKKRGITIKFPENTTKLSTTIFEHSK